MAPPCVDVTVPLRVNVLGVGLLGVGLVGEPDPPPQLTRNSSAAGSAFFMSIRSSWAGGLWGTAFFLSRVQTSTYVPCVLCGFRTRDWFVSHYQMAQMPT